MSSTKHHKQPRGISSLDTFKAVVDCLCEARDAGKLQVFFGPLGSARLVGDLKVLARGAKQRPALADVEEDACQELFREVILVLSASDRFGPSVVSVLSRTVFEDAYEQAKKGGKAEGERFLEQLKEKVTYVDDRLFTDFLRQRTQRFETASRPCLEDLEFEIVKERNVDPESQSFRSPFLLLRIRHARKHSPSEPIPFFAFPWAIGGQRAADGVDSFDLECDESDIDLLMERLREAKQRLIECRG